MALRIRDEAEWRRLQKKMNLGARGEHSETPVQEEPPVVYRVVKFEEPSWFDQARRAWPFIQALLMVFLVAWIGFAVGPLFGPLIVPVVILAALAVWRIYWRR